MPLEIFSGLPGRPAQIEFSLTLSTAFTALP